jgi:hypothetical protein
MMGRSGTWYFPLLYSIRAPLLGTGTPLNDAMLETSGTWQETNHYKEY